MNTLRSVLETSIDIRRKLLEDMAFQNAVSRSVELMYDAFTAGNKVLFCGNGGSAADAQHIAAELSGRFRINRKPLFAEALHVNSSYMTAVANDYGFDECYARMCEAMGRTGDVLVAISTSGNSANVINAMKQAKALGMHTIALLGEAPGEMAGLANIVIRVPSGDTARIQEVHITIGHVMCEMIENAIFGE